jgi:hypothetical protein
VSVVIVNGEVEDDIDEVVDDEVELQVLLNLPGPASADRKN